MRYAETSFPRQSIWFQNGEIRPPLDHHRAPTAARRLVILIHGYNTAKTKAETGYAAFRNNATRVVGAARVDSLWSFFWPGYAEAALPTLRRHVTQRLRYTEVPVTQSLAASIALYSLQVRKAREIGRLLGRYLARLCHRGVPREIIVIAHSLGCRLTLEAVAEFAKAGEAVRNQLRVVCLMAAAVPTNMVKGDASLGVAARIAGRTHVLYSRRDRILRWTFPTGQLLAGEDYRRDAIGLSGAKREMRCSRTDETTLKHGEYWSSLVTTPHLAQWFGVTASRDLPAQPLTDWQNPAAAQLPESSLPDSKIR